MTATNSTKEKPVCRRLITVASRPKNQTFCSRPASFGLVGSSKLDVYTSSGAVEFHLAISQGKNRIVASEPDVAAGLEFGAALANNNIARDHRFAAEFLNTETLALAVASVLDASLSFFMGHDVR